MRFRAIHFRSFQITRLLLLGLSICQTTIAASAAISLDALQRAGYGMAELKLHSTNTLTVSASINGRNARLIVDTGWSDEGITVDSEYASALHSISATEDRPGRGASGKEIAGLKTGIAPLITLGNVQMREVPVHFGRIGTLKNNSMHHRVNADGFIGSEFLRTCSAVIDLQNLRLYLRPPGTGSLALIGPALKSAHLVEVPFKMMQNICILKVEINGVPSMMVMDTGASFAYLDQRFVAKIGTVGFSAHRESIDAAGVTERSELTELHSFKIAGIEARNTGLITGTFAFYDETRGEVTGLVGMDILGKNGSIIDFGQRMLYFYPL